MENDYPTLSQHFPECFKSIKSKLVKSNDQAQAKISQLITAFTQRLEKASDQTEIDQLNGGLVELRQLLKATIQIDIDEYLTA